MADPYRLLSLAVYGSGTVGVRQATAARTTKRVPLVRPHCLLQLFSKLLLFLRVLLCDLHRLLALAVYNGGTIGTCQATAARSTKSVGLILLLLGIPMLLLLHPLFPLE